MSKHTPGPWENVGGTIEARHSNGDTLIIADVIGGEGTRFEQDDQNAECLANARLIAAAPELLAAAILALDWMDKNRCLLRDSAPLRAAIEKATK